MSNVILLPVIYKKGKSHGIPHKERSEVLKQYEFNISHKKKKEYSQYFYNLMVECGMFIEKREQDEPYALGLPREALKQFSQETVKLLRSLRSVKAAKDIRCVLVEANRSATFLQFRFAEVALLPFQCGPKLEKIFRDVTSLLMTMERRLDPLLIPSADDSFMQIK